MQKGESLDAVAASAGSRRCTSRPCRADRPGPPGGPARDPGPRPRAPSRPRSGPRARRAAWPSGASTTCRWIPAPPPRGWPSRAAAS
jgi:hypothetical protein